MGINCPECKSKEVGFICILPMDRLAFICKNKKCRTIFIVANPRRPEYITKISQLDQQFPLAPRQRTQLTEKIREEILPQIFDQISSSDQVDQVFVIKQQKIKQGR